MLFLFSVTAIVFNTILLGFVTRRLLGVPVGWPRTILVSGSVFAAMGGVSRRVLAHLGIDVGDDAALAALDPVVAVAVPTLLVAWSVAVGIGILVILEAMVPTGTLPRPLALLRDLPARRRRARRYTAIVAIAVRHGLGGFLRSRPHTDLGADAPRVARSLRLAMTEAGVTFIKLGQMLSTRPDLVGDAFASELGRLTSDVAPQPWATVEQTLRAELGADPAEVFGQIDHEPLAAASVGQVHAARLRDGSPVVVKVQRTDARAQVTADMDIITRLATWLERTTDWGSRLGVRGLADGFAANLEEELDYRVEAANMDAIAAASGGGGTVPVRVPTVYAELSGPRVLVMERMAGRELSRAGELLAGFPPERRAEMARTLLGAVLRQVLDEGVFHADLHAGNVFVDDDGTLGLLDFGSVGRLDSAGRSGLTRLILAVDRQDSVGATDALLGVLDRPAGLDDRAVERELGGLIGRYGHGLGGAGSAGLFGDLMGLVVRHGFAVPPAVAAAFRSLGALEGTLRTLDPQLDLMDAARDAGRDLAGERLQPDRLKADLAEQLTHLLPVLQRIPRRLDALADAAQRGELSVNVRVLADERDRSFVSGLVQQLTVTLLAAAAAIGGILLVLAADRGPEVSEGVALYPLLGATLFLFAFVLAARALAVAFTHHARTYWGARR